jgi:hypothetical protein
MYILYEVQIVFLAKVRSQTPLEIYPNHQKVAEQTQSRDSPTARASHDSIPSLSKSKSLPQCPKQESNSGWARWNDDRASLSQIRQLHICYIPMRG